MNMNNPEEQSYQPAHTVEQAGVRQEKIVEAIKVSTVFPDRGVLESIADSLLSEGIISGFHIDKALSGYFFGGKKIEEEQYSLEIVVDSSGGDEIVEKIRNRITETIGKKWEAPAIEIEKIHINEKFLGYIKSGGTEHKKYLDQKRRNLTLTLTAILSLTTAIGLVGKKFVDKKAEAAAEAAALVEIEKAYKEIKKIEREIENETHIIDIKQATKQPLTSVPHEFGETYAETARIREATRNLEFVYRKLSQKQGK